MKTADQITAKRTVFKTEPDKRGKYTLASGGPYCDCGYKKTAK